MPCSNKHGVNCGDDLPVLEQTDDVDASFDNNNYARVDVIEVGPTL